ncbi:MAG: hypothetical protein IAE82_03005 [Opitutaceae bacterium]|nr:hypothetical protein [Opitutaceae bacterium]
MSWPLSFVVAVVSGIAGGVGAGLVAHVFVAWFRVTGREGAAGFMVVGVGLLGILGGFVIGLICARVVAAGGSPGFLKALGLGLGATAGLLVLVLGCGWLAADFPPRIDGHDLVLEVEVRFPPAISLPDPKSGDLYRWHVTLTAMSGGRDQTRGDMRLSEVVLTDGRPVVAASVPLATSAPQRSLGVGCGDYGTQFFDLPLAAQPTRADGDWSAWLTKPHEGNRAPISAEKAVEARYRVRLQQDEPSLAK